MKNRVFILVVLLLLLALGACGQQEAAPEDEVKPAEAPATETAIAEPDPEPVIEILYPEPVWTAEYVLRFGGENLDSKCYMIKNRAYICPNRLEEPLGLELKFKEEDLHWPAYQIGEDFFVSIADADRLWDVFAKFQDNGTVAVFRGHYDFKPLTEGTDLQPSALSNEEKTAAYIRLEDIMADFGDNERFTHLNMEKLRVFGKYLGQNSDGFYIAWIPKYVNPGKGTVNDISRDFNFYNADFVYTMDVLIDAGGRVGLHGLTHQRDDQKSASGWEFDGPAGLSQAQAEARMIEAARICNDMGWDYYFFEFPHYGATGPCFNAANRLFDVVYQQSPYMEKKGFVDGHKVEDRTVWYVPTPADCLQSPYDTDALIGRMKASDKRGNVQSIFFHPVQDADNMIISSDLYDRTYKIDEGRSALKKVCLYLESAGERFKYFDFVE
jgi:hypothetical protein